MQVDVKKVARGVRDHLIIAFSGHGKTFEFENFLTDLLDCDHMLLRDTYCSNYHRGVEGVSTDVESTFAFLQEDARSYKRVTCLGISAGGYAAILFGSLLKAARVVAFVPQTILRRSDKDPRYRDLLPLMDPGVEYVLYCDRSVLTPTHPHHASHCERVANNNVRLVYQANMNMKAIRDSGDLGKLLEEH
jgi:hypothetical protein